MMRLRRTLVCCAVGATALAACTSPTSGGGGGTVPTASTLRASTVSDGESRNGVTSANGDYVVYLSTTTDGSLGADGNGAGADVFLDVRHRFDRAGHRR